MEKAESRRTSEAVDGVEDGGGEEVLCRAGVDGPV